MRSRVAIDPVEPVNRRASRKTRLGLTTLVDAIFGVSWNAPLEKEGLVVGNSVEITIDAEAILEEL
ncbi:MAG: hypothetical protein ABWZ17_08590 [Candidatus Binatia bacterium]